MARTMSDAEDTVRYWLGEEFGGPVTGSDHDQFNAAVRTLLAELDAERAAHEATKARRALAEAVCRTLYACPYPPDGVVLDALEAWRAAK